MWGMNLQASTEEHAHDAKLAPTRHGKLAELSHRYNNDN